MACRSAEGRSLSLIAPRPRWFQGGQQELEAIDREGRPFNLLSEGRVLMGL